MIIYESDIAAFIFLIIGCACLFGKSVTLTVSAGNSGIGSYVKESDKATNGVAVSQTQKRNIGFASILFAIAIFALFRGGDILLLLNI